MQRFDFIRFHLHKYLVRTYFKSSSTCIVDAHKVAAANYRAKTLTVWHRLEPIAEDTYIHFY